MNLLQQFLAAAAIIIIMVALVSICMDDDPHDI